MTTNSLSEEKQNIRRQIKAQRRALDCQAQRQYNKQFHKQLKRCLPLLNVSKIGIYLPFQGEAPTQIICDIAPLSTQIYIPKILNYPKSIMRFTPAKNSMQKNRWGILESTTLNGLVSAQKLDLIVLPLVAFDLKGNRLGMGGGYYDRSLAFLNNSTNVRNKPLLLGLAYDFQQTESIPTQDWDIALDIVVTNQEVIYNKAPNNVNSN